MDRELIRKQIERANDVADMVGTKYESMTYEQGVAEALQWVLDDCPSGENMPMPDED